MNPVEIMMSNRHAHLSPEVCGVLFGKDYELTEKKNIGLGEFICEETVTAVTEKGKIEGIRVMGPCREFTQIELFRGDCFTLGVDAPVRYSGDLRDAAVLKLVGPAGEVEVACGIIALRHVHIGNQYAEARGIENGQMVSVKINGDRETVFSKALVRIHKGKAAILHIDVEEGNAAMVRNKDIGELIL